MSLTCQSPSKMSMLARRGLRKQMKSWVDKANKAVVGTPLSLLSVIRELWQTRKDSSICYLPTLVQIPPSSFWCIGMVQSRSPRDQKCYKMKNKKTKINDMKKCLSNLGNRLSWKLYGRDGFLILPQSCSYSLRPLTNMQPSFLFCLIYFCSNRCSKECQEHWTRPIWIY